jgi:NADH-quinone oxidoreductase subunit C
MTSAAELAEAINARVPGAVGESAQGFVDMPTLTVRRESLLEVCRLLRDEHGKNLLSAVTAVDFLGYGEPVAGYFGTERGRDINAVGSWGAAETVDPPPTRFATVYHLAHIGKGPVDRIRLQVFLEEGEEVDSVVPVWPTADWFEREQFDLVGIVFRGHPNLRRLIMPSDWAGHPLRKDYPIGGEPVQFTDAQ